MGRQPAIRTCPSDSLIPPLDSSPTIETQLAKLQAQFDLLKVQVRQAQQLASLGTAATTMVHEVNNWLTPILSYAKAALEANDVELHRKALTVTIRNVEVLVAMSERVLEISAARPPKRELVSVRAMAQDAAASLCRDLSKDGIRFSIDVEESITVWADALQLKQVFFNLFLNAREAMASVHSGRLTVSAKGEGQRVLIAVRNTGAAIPPDRLPHVFDPLHSSKAAERGGRNRCAGLGLALCRDLTEENGGTISVTSEANTGTTFTLALPATERNAQ